jgi:HEAT repeat protein
VSRLPTDAATDLLTDTDAQVRAAAADAAGIRQIRQLGELLAGDADVGVRRAAAHALGNLSGDDVTQALITGMADGDPVVRTATLRALERGLGHDLAIRRITCEFIHSDPRRRRAALYALAHLMARDVGSEVWRLADDPDADVRFALIDTAAILVGDAEPLWSYMATDPDPAVRASAENRRLRAIERR